MNIPTGHIIEYYYELLRKAKGDSKYPYIPPLKNKEGIIYPDMGRAVENAFILIQELQVDPLEYMRAQIKPYLRSRMRTLFPPSKLYGEGAKRRYLKFIENINGKYATAQERYTSREIKQQVENDRWDKFLQKNDDILSTLYLYGGQFSGRFIIGKLLDLSLDEIENYLEFLKNKNSKLFDEIKKELVRKGG